MLDWRFSYLWHELPASIACRALGSCPLFWEGPVSFKKRLLTAVLLFGFVATGSLSFTSSASSEEWPCGGCWVYYREIVIIDGNQYCNNAQYCTPSQTHNCCVVA